MHLLTNELDVPDDERLRLAGVHLEHLKDYRHAIDGFDVLHAAYLEQIGKLEEAAELLKPMINSMEMAALRRLQLDLQLDRADDVQRDAAALHEHLVQAQRKGEPFDALRWQAMAQAEQILGNQPLWSRAVREWQKLAPEDPQARQNLVVLDQIEFNSMLQSSHANAQELAMRLAEAMRLIEQPQALETQIAALYKQRRQSRPVSEMFTILADSDTTPTPLLACLGALAAIDGDLPLARRLLERVVAADPEHAVAWNNLAWALSKEPGQDLDRALAAVNEALERRPEEFRFRETRGQILVALGRWDEAVGDLEFALNGMPDAADVHGALATAYERLGQTDLATIHRQQAE
jgi:tetratricopeptide (TPR) repeat protein